MVDGNASKEEIDTHILSSLYLGTAMTPKRLAENRLRESAVRNRCRRLSDEQLVEQISHDVFRITDVGTSFVDSGNEMSDREIAYPKPQENRITDFSNIDPEDIKWQNRRYFRNPDHRYDVDQHARHRTIQRINQTRNGDLRRIMEEFPTREALPKQCAHWVRSLVGLHFFPDANHRTAMSTLNVLLRLNGVKPLSWGDKRYRSAIYKSKLIRRFILDVRFDNLWMRDELYHLWHRYFVGYFYDVPGYDHYEPQYDHVEKLLNQVGR
jgi:prophage maintenance system killer protein